MIARIPFGKFVPGNTVIHRLNPKIRLSALCLIMLTVLLVRNWIDLLVISSLVLTGVVFSKSPISELVRDVWSLRYFYIITIVLHSILDKGTTPISFDVVFTELTITAEGLNAGLFFSLKLVILALVLTPLMRTMHPSRWVSAFQIVSRNDSPFYRAVARFSMTLGLTIRFLPLILTDAERIRLAQIGRGLAPGRGPYGKIKSLVPLIIPLFNSVLGRADSITAAMQSRGYKLNRIRINYRPESFGIIDIWAIILMLIVLVLLLVNNLSA